MPVQGLNFTHDYRIPNGTVTLKAIGWGGTNRPSTSVSILYTVGKVYECEFDKLERILAFEIPKILERVSKMNTK